MTIVRPLAFGLLFAIASLPAQTITLAPEIVTASRAPQPPEHTASTVHVLDQAAVQTAPTLSLDGVLRALPGFSLFRRSDSLTANPPSQGVSLRGLGPSGASRSLVLLDGIPLNDPFGGWVAWTKIPRDSLTRVEVVPGGGASAWGNAALGGVIQMISPGGISPTRSTQAVATFGDFGTRSIEFSHREPIQRAELAVSARAFATDGFPLVASEDRGPIDIDAWSRHRWLTATWRQTLGESLQFAVTARGYEEKRGNGTPYQQNSSREKFASLALAGQPGSNFAWNAVAYAQDQSFASTFSSVNAARTAETPASDQFAVPSTALGAAWTGIARHPSEGRTSFGADARFVRGETREHYTFVNSAFTRLRVAGGRQLVGGVFALHERALGEALRGTLGGRVDAWSDTDGHRRESDRISGAVLRNDHYADRDGTTFSPSAGLLWTPARSWRVRANAQKAFRRPTLNEFYRPFRVGPNVTEANATLGTEKVTSAEAGAEWRLIGAQPTATSTPTGAPRTSVSTGTMHGGNVALLTLGATAFHNDLRDAVGNVTLARGPGTFPLFGVIAAGGVGRQRLNLDRLRVRGVELSARWSALDEVSLTADYLYNDATVQRTSLAPALVGNRIAQVPRHSAAVGAVWRGPFGITATPRLRWIGRQFEDDENQLILGEVVIADLGLTRALAPHLELFVTGENIGNARIETGRPSEGLVSTGTPRLVVGGVRGRW